MKKKKIGPYALQSKAGEGEITELFFAVNKRVPRQLFIVKKVKPGLVDDRDSIVAFEREAAVLSSLNHPNLVKIIDYYHNDHALVMEYIHGRNLAHLIKNYGRLPLEIVLYVTAHICEGIHHLHCKNVVHCDIKPGNILISYTGEVKVCDFGIAKVLNSLSGSRESRSIPAKGSFRGTMAYTSPEQVLNTTVGFYSDIYSLGIVCYEMLTGEMLNVFGKNVSTTDIMSYIVNTSIPPVATIRDGVPKSLNNLVIRCLSKEIDRRFQDTQSLLDGIQAIQQESAMMCSHLQLSDLVK